MQTTVPGLDNTCDPVSEAPSFGLVVLWSKTEPHRRGEIAFLPTFEVRIVGRGDDDLRKFVTFGRQRPGEPLLPTRQELAGDSISRRQLSVRATALAVEIERLGNCPTVVNGVPLAKDERATLHPGDTVMFSGEVLLLCVRRHRTLPRLRRPLALHAFGERDASGIVGESPMAWLLRDELALAAHSDHHVLILGESGSGKEMAAAIVHRQSVRAKGPWVEHNAASFTLSLLETELSGNSQNFPNPGMPARKGLLGSADQGTLFFDEIGDCPLEAQTQLLRFLDSGEIKVVGESIPRRVDVRMVGATNRDPKSLRQDFFGRFAVNVRIPPLRERQEDIPLLIHHLLLEHGRKDPEVAERFFEKGPSGEPQPRISGTLVDQLVRHSLPLNVRELRKLVLAAVATSAGDVVRMPSSNPSSPPFAVPSGLKKMREQRKAEDGQAGTPLLTEADLLARLERHGWKVSGIANELGKHRNVVYRMMDKYGIKPRLDEDGN
jgi:DNA-binding NtrC family response regulator